MSPAGVKDYLRFFLVHVWPVKKASDRTFRTASDGLSYSGDLGNWMTNSVYSPSSDDTEIFP